MKRNIFTSLAIACLFSFNAQALPPTLEFNTLSVDPNGTVWIGTNQFLYNKPLNGELAPFPMQITDQIGYPPVNDMSQYTAATPYRMILGTTKGEVVSTLDAGTIVHSTPEIPTGAVAIDGNTWWTAATAGGFSVKGYDQLSSGGYPMNVTYFDTSQKFVFDNNPVNSITLHRDTAYMIVANNESRGVERFVKGVDAVSGASPYEKWGPCPLNNVLCMAIDNKGEQWFGSKNGLYWHQSSSYFDNWQVYTTSDGLPENHVQSVTTTANGYAWAGTQQGISRVGRDAASGSIQVKSYSVNDGDIVIDMAAGPDNTVYAITKKTLYVISNDIISPVDHIAIEKVVNAANISIYPNPASDFINVELDLERPAEANIALFSLTGQKVLQLYQGAIEAKETLSFPLSGIIPGSYLCTLTIGKDCYTNIIVIK